MSIHTPNRDLSLVGHIAEGVEVVYEHKAAFYHDLNAISAAVPEYRRCDFYIVWQDTHDSLGSMITPKGSKFTKFFRRMSMNIMERAYHERNARSYEQLLVLNSS